MSMTREETIEELERLLRHWDLIDEGIYDLSEHDQDAVEMALSALRPVSREQVEKMRGEWIIEDAGDGDRRKKCSLCDQPISGWWGRDRFCANCGAPMTDEAVDMVMERLEVLHAEN